MTGVGPAEIVFGAGVYDFTRPPHDSPALLATLYHRDAGMISTIDDLYRKINSKLQQFCFVVGAIQLPRCSSEAFDPANLDDCH